MALAHGGSIKEKIIAFLEGSGIPCPLLFDKEKASFCALLDLSQVNTPAFHLRMFAWATAGSPFIDPDSEMITVRSFLLLIYLFLPHRS